MKHLILITLLTVAGWPSSADADASDSPAGAQFLPGVSVPIQGRDAADRLERYLELTSDEKSFVDPIIRRHLSAIASIRQDTTLTPKQKKDQLDEEWSTMIDQVKPFLTPGQARKLDDISSNRIRIHPQVTANTGVYFPTGPAFRSIFGDSPSSLGLGLGFGQVATIGVARLTFSVDSLSTEAGSNKLFVGAPQLALVTGTPIAPRVYAFGRVSAGPAYMDYSFDTSAGNHIAAKRLGADGLAEIGLLWGPVRVSAGYRFLTEPAGINFSGFLVTATLSLFRF
jgi:hypothetical protein